MSRSSNLFLGLFGTFAVSCAAMVLIPQTQLGGLQPHYTEEEGKITDLYPVRNDAAEQGREVYVSQGCIHCHTQQIRDPQNGTDIERGWGPRRTVARDYIYEQPPLLGSQRLGPDLTNIGTADWRNEEKGDIARKPAKRDSSWHLLHLYAPRIVVSESNHPPYRYLFETRQISGQRSASALNLPKGEVKEGYEVVPTERARKLVNYLLSLDRTHALAEAPAPGGGAAGSTTSAGATPAK